MTDPVRASIHIEAEPEHVFRYLTQPDAMVRWMGEFAHLDPRTGGEFRVDVKGAPVRGRYLEVEAPRRVVLSWGYAGSERLPPGASRVEIRLTPEDGGTTVDLTHSELPEEDLAGHESGWTHYLGRLTISAPGGEPGPDPGMGAPPT